MDTASIAIALGLILLAGASVVRPARKSTPAKRSYPVHEEDLIYDGASGGISRNDIHAILARRHSYYAGLNYRAQQRFLSRCETFMKKKKFLIKGGELFREMPVMTTAAAIQLTFGLNDFILPYFPWIRIFPEEFIAAHSFRLLAGNVQDRVITVAWNHFLSGYEDPADGSNVGLHEMSHALYYQHVCVDQDEWAPRFCALYRQMSIPSDAAWMHERAGRIDLYTAYAETSAQEFWAESIERFFEKPVELNRAYPDLYEHICALLNQNPIIQHDPVLIPRGAWRDQVLLLRILVLGK